MDSTLTLDKQRGKNKRRRRRESRLFSLLSTIVAAAVFHLLRFSLRCLPPLRMLAFTSLIGRCYVKLCPVTRRVLLAQSAFALQDLTLAESVLSRCPALGPGSQAKDWLPKLPQAVFSHLGESFGELMIMDRLLSVSSDESSENASIPDFPHITPTNPGLIEVVRAQPCGVLALSAHLGCFELLAAYYIRCGIRISAVGRVPNYDWVNYLLRELRSSYGVQAIWRTRYNQAISARRVVRALQEPGVVAVLLDQDTKLENAFAPFFGLEAASPIASVRIAVQNGLTVLTSFIVRESRLRHRVITDLIEYDQRDPNAVDFILRTYNSRLEALIRQYPEQWLWWHRRWRRRPGVDYRKHPKLVPGTDAYLAWLGGIGEKRKLEAAQSYE